MPTSFTSSDKNDKQINRSSITVDPTVGLVITGIKVTDGLVEEVYVKSANVVGTYGTDYGYSGGEFGNDADYYQVITSESPTYGTD